MNHKCHTDFGGVSGFKYWENTGTQHNPKFKDKSKSSSWAAAMNSCKNADKDRSIEVLAQARVHGVFVDLDNDNDLDLVLGGLLYHTGSDGVTVKKIASENHKFSTKILYLKNIGNKHEPEFLLQTGSSSPFSGLFIESGINGKQDRDACKPWLIPACHDFDGDGKLHCIAATGKWGNMIFLRNTGTTSNPTFELESEVSDTTYRNRYFPDGNWRNGNKFGCNEFITFADVDSDGDEDLIRTATGPTSDPDKKFTEMHYHENVPENGQSRFRLLSDSNLVGRDNVPGDYVLSNKIFASHEKGASDEVSGMWLTMAFGDLDSDDDVDMMVMSDSAGMTYFKNKNCYTSSPCNRGGVCRSDGEGGHKCSCFKPFGGAQCDMCMAGFSEAKRISGDAAIAVSPPQCEPCSPGSWSEKEGSINGTCSSCDRGRFGQKLGESSSASCEECPLGWYQDTEGLPFCLPCVPGKYNDNLGLNTECKLCDIGKFSNETELTACFDCASGQSTSGQKGSAGCQNCAAGTYGDNCDSCTGGKFRAGSDEDASKCKDCLAGKYQDAMGQAACLPCIPGEWWWLLRCCYCCCCCDSLNFSHSHLSLRLFFSFPLLFLFLI